MTRTPEEVFAHHAQALGAGDLDEIVADYADDGVFITSSGIMRGKEGVRAAFTQLLSDLPNASWALKTQIFDGDLLFLVVCLVNGWRVVRYYGTVSAPGCGVAPVGW